MSGPKIIEDEFRSLSLSSANGAVAARPDNGGTSGRSIALRANVYPVTFKKPDFKIFHYDVAIVPVGSVKSASKPGRAAEVERALPAPLCREVFDKLMEDPKLVQLGTQAAFDGRKSAYTAIPFPGTGGPNAETYTVELPPHTEQGRLRSFTIKVTLAQELDLSVLQQFIARTVGSADLEDKVATAIQAIDILLKHDAGRRPSVIVAGRGQKYFNASTGSDLGLGASVLKGYFQSVRPTQSGFVANLDSAYSPYLKSGNFKSICNEIVGRSGGDSGGGGRGGRGGMRGGPSRVGFGGGVGRPGATGEYSREELRELKTKLRGAKVRVTHRVTRQIFTVEGFGRPPKEQMIDIGGTKGEGFSAVQLARMAAAGTRGPTERPVEDARRLSLAEYFKEKYNYTDSDGDLQCIELKGGQFVPIGCLELLPGKSIPPTKLNSDQASRMIKVAAKAPIERRGEIENVRSICKYESNARIGSWGITVGQEMQKVNGRILQPPRVQYKTSSPNVAHGAWNLIGCKFTGRNRPLEHWGVICFARNVNKDEVTGFLGKLINQANERGMAVVNKQPPLIRGFDRPPVEALKDACRQVMEGPNNTKKTPPQLLVMILQDPKMYDAIKRSAFFDLPVPIVTQVLLAKNIQKPNVDQYIGNVLLKLNVKLFGHNWHLDPQSLPKITEKTIIMGADVTHPPPGSRMVQSSIAALVTTSNDTMTEFHTQVREQQGRQEIISDLENMVWTLVRAWKGSKGQKPENIIFYRDGVGEGQYKTVVDHEVAAVKAACNRIDSRHPWKLTYIICGKRHHLRFFPERQEDVARDRSGNLPAGTVVDTTVTHPYLFDFYLQSHAGLVGTARPTHYVVLLDENRFSSEEVEKLTNSLSYTFVRATRSVSLVPVAYYADIVCTKARSYVYDDADETSTNVSGASGNSKSFDPKRIQNRLDKVAPGYQFAPMWFM